MTEKSSSKTLYATAYYFDWEKFHTTGEAELYLDQYYKPTQIKPERSEKPIVKGIMAFFCNPLGGDKPTLIQALKSNKPFSIDFYYNYYFDIRYQVKAQKNAAEPCSKRLSEKDIINEIYDSEDSMRTQVRKFIDSYLAHLEIDVQQKLREYAGDFLLWVSETYLKGIKPQPLILQPQKDQKRTTDEIIISALRWIEPLSGKNLQGYTQIMSNNDFKNLCNSVTEMIKTERCPENIKPINNVNISSQYLKKTFHMIHKDNYGLRPQRPYFLEFLVKVFPKKFESVKDPIELKKNFSSYSSGEHDFLRDYNKLKTQISHNQN
ncbi:MAG TPA: hypothetical protein PLS41_01835 [Bacteroidales bacterium]|nr:hypothetical protein [Bacteroidales bacterium]HPE86044.1 hypothetical protein [Bacteroidales bacterium]